MDTRNSRKEKVLGKVIGSFAHSKEKFSLPLNFHAWHSIYFIPGKILLCFMLEMAGC